MTLTQELAQALRGAEQYVKGRMFQLTSIDADKQTIAGVATDLKQIAAALDRFAAEPPTSPSCPQCGAPGLLYECVACSASSYPPTSRGSEGEAKPVAWLITGSRIFVDCASTSKQQAENTLASRNNDGSRIQPLFAVPPPAQPSAEAWRQAIGDWWNSVGWKASQIEIEEMDDWIETRAREIHAASCATMKGANSSQSEEPRT